MIDSKDIMQGNLVIYEDKVYAVDKICSIYIDLDSLGVGSSESIYPIPVTPELLERIGFKKEEHDIDNEGFKSFLYRGKEYNLQVYDWYNNFIGDRKYDLHVDNVDFEGIGGGCFGYLHELQNLVRVITGHDLPITKEMLG